MKTRRRQRKLRLKDLASLTDRSVPLLSMVEKGFIPHPDTCERIAKALDSTVVELWPDGSFE